MEGAHSPLPFLPWFGCGISFLCESHFTVVCDPPLCGCAFFAPVEVPPVSLRDVLIRRRRFSMWKTPLGPARFSLRSANLGLDNFYSFTGPSPPPQAVFGRIFEPFFWGRCIPPPRLAFFEVQSRASNTYSSPCASAVGVFSRFEEERARNRRVQITPCR